MILGGGVAVCLLLSAHRAVIFAIAQLSCYMLVWLTTVFVAGSLLCLPGDVWLHGRSTLVSVFHDEILVDDA